MSSSEPSHAGRQRLLVIAPHGSYRTSAFVAAASRLGVEVLIASEGRHSIVSHYARGLHLDLSDEEASLQQILDEAASRPFGGIVGTDDSTTGLAARAAAILGLPHNPPEAVRLGWRKDLARNCLRQAGLPVPRYRCLDLRRPLAPQIADLVYPLVVKPVALSGSRGVIRVDNEMALQQAVARIVAIIQGEARLPAEVAQTLLLEAFIPGEEVAVEGMLQAGRLQILSVFDKPDPLDGPFFEETYYTTPSRHPPAVLAEVERVVQAACTAYGLREGPVHAECRLNGEGVWILEVAARTIGGLCGRLLRFGTGYTLEELVLAQAMGQPLPMTARRDAAGVLMIPIPQAGILKRVEGLLEAQRVEYIESVEIQIREGHELVPLPEGASYLGFMFARAPSAAEAEAALRRAHACLNIIVAPLWKISVA